jgi:hypothetical protein
VRESDHGGDREGLHVDLGLEEPVEQDKAVCASLHNSQCEFTERGEVGRELDCHGHLKLLFERMYHLHASRLDFATRPPHAVGHVIEVALDSGGAGVLRYVRVRYRVLNLLLEQGVQHHCRHTGLDQLDDPVCRP